MAKHLMIICASVCCFAVFMSGCAGINTYAIKNKLAMMSDKELLDHYEMLEMRMTDLNRNTQESIDQKRYIYNDTDAQNPYNQIAYLHIGDEWTKLRKEKDLTLDEIKKRGLPLP